MVHSDAQVCDTGEPFTAGPAGLAGEMPADGQAIWTFRTHLTPEEYRTTEAKLSADERRRAQGFAFELDRRRFVATRARLRSILGGCLAVHPSSLRFQYGPFGKPLLEGEAGSQVHFSVAHSGDRALVAVARKDEIGVDLERVRSVPALPAIVKRFFSRREGRVILSSSARVDLAFFHHWTLKEAWLKGMGVGWRGWFRDVEVGHGSGGMLLMRQVTGARESLPWRLHSWSPAPGFVAALATALV